MERQDTPPTPQDFEPGINFKGLFEQAKDLLPDDLSGTVDAPAPASGPPDIPSIADVAAKVSETPQIEATPNQEPSPETSSEVREFKDSDLVRIKVDGKEEVVSYKDYRDGIQREAVFTKRMQTLAQQRAEAEQTLANQYAQLYQAAQQVAWQKQQLDEHNPLAKLAQRLEAEKEVAPQDPNTLATIGEIQKALSEHKQQVEQQLIAERTQQQRQLATAAQTLRATAAQQADAQKFTSALNQTLSNKDMAVVSTAVPDPRLADAIIRYRVAEMAPQTIDEGIEFMQTVVKEWADGLRAQNKQDSGRAAATKARATIETPIGSAPAPQSTTKPTSFMKKDGGLDWNVLHQRALAGLE